MDNISNALDNLFNVIETNPSELLNIKHPPVIVSLKQLAIYHQRFELAVILRNEEKRRNNLKEELANKQD